MCTKVGVRLQFIYKTIPATIFFFFKQAPKNITKLLSCKPSFQEKENPWVIWVRDSYPVTKLVTSINKKNRAGLEVVFLEL